MNKKMIFFALAITFFFNIVQSTVAYDTIILTSKTENLTITQGWEVNSTTDTPLLLEHQYTFNAQKNHLYNPSNLNKNEEFLDQISYFVNSENTTVAVRNFHYVKNITYTFCKNLGLLANTTFTYQIYCDVLPNITLYRDTTRIVTSNITYDTGDDVPDFFYVQPAVYVFLKKGAPQCSGDEFTNNLNQYPNAILTFRVSPDNTFIFTIKAQNASIYQAGTIAPYGIHTTIGYEIPEISLAGYLNTAFLQSNKLSNNITLRLDFTNPDTLRDVVYAENANWWLPDSNSSILGFSGINQEQKNINVLGFDENDITTFIKCHYINYQKPISWESRFSQNLTVSRYSDTKYFSEFPQLAYQTSAYPVLDTFDVFNVTNNYYISAFGILKSGVIYGRSLFQVFSTDNEFMISAAWETTNNFNLTLVVAGVPTSIIAPAIYATTNDFIETGIFVINNTYFGVLVGGMKLALFNITTGITNRPRELQVYGSLFRGSEVRNDINVTELISGITTYFHPQGAQIPLFSMNFFLSKYRQVSLILKYGLDIVSPSQDESKYRKNYTFSSSDIYFREGSSEAYLTSTSNRNTLAVIYLMQISKADTIYSQAQLYNRTVYHNDLAGKKAKESIHVDIYLNFVMLTLDYIVPLTLVFSITLTYYIFANIKVATGLEFFLSAPIMAAIIPLILLIIFPLMFYDASGNRKLFAAIGLLVGIVIDGILGFIDPILSVLFAIIASGIMYITLKKNGVDM